MNYKQSILKRKFTQSIPITKEKPYTAKDITMPELKQRRFIPKSEYARGMRKVLRAIETM